MIIIYIIVRDVYL